MITRKLWYALHHPPARHPLFLRTVLLPSPAQRRFVSWATLLIDLILGVAFNTPTLLFLLMPFFLLIIGFSYGIDCALRVSTTIAKEHEDRTFDLLSLAPTGVWGTNWALATSSLYRNRDFDRLFSIVRAALAIALVITVIVALISFMSLTPTGSTTVRQPGKPDLLLNVVAAFISVLALIAAIYLEYAQSTVLGTLVGLFIPTFAHNRLDASLWAFGVFMLLQIIAYAVTWLIGFNILPVAYERLQLNGWYASFSLPVLRVAVFFLVREGIILMMWRGVIRRLNAQVSEVEWVMQPSA